MTNASPDPGQWTESSNAPQRPLRDTQSMFRLLFERSTDAIFLFEPRQQVFVDCNQAAVDMMRAASKQQLLLTHPANLSPEFQPDGQTSREKTPKMVEIALTQGSHRFEWIGRRFDGTNLPLEVLTIPIES